MREYYSSLSCYITGLIQQIRACGHIYEYEAYILESFDRFCIEQKSHCRNNYMRSGDAVGNSTAHRRKEYPQSAGLVCTPACTLHAITWGESVHSQAFCIGDGGCAAYLLPGGIGEFLLGCRCVCAATTYLSSVGSDLPSAISPFLLLRSPCPRDPSLHQHYSVSSLLRSPPPPRTAMSAPHGVPVAAHAPAPPGLLVLPVISSSDMPSSGLLGSHRSALPQQRRPSPFLSRVGSNITRFEACSTFTHVTACLFADPPK